MNQSTRESIQNRPLLLAMTVCLLMSALLWGSLTPLAAQGPDASDNATSSQEQAWQNQFPIAQTPAAAPLGGGMSNVACIDGFAGPFPCDNMDLLAWIPLPELGATENPSVTNGNDSWGWTDSDGDGTEYVIMGHSDGATFLDISDPINPVIVGHLAPNTAPNRGHLWGDYKVYANTLYKINESSGEGMQFFDLTQLRDAALGTEFTASGVYTGFGNAHNVVVNVDSGYAYAVGTGRDGMDMHCEGGGLHIVNINDPWNPTFAGCFDEDGYTHDAQCVMYGGPDAAYAGAEICFNSNEDSITIADVSDKMNTTLVATQTYETASYSHQGWLTDDHQYFIMNDELDEFFGVVTDTTTYVWDVSDLDNPTLVGTHSANNTAIDHNLYVIGNMIYEANYASGLRILQANDWSTADLSEIAYFDTHPEHDDPAFNGIWNAYPFFESGVIALNDFERGMFLVRHNAQVTAVSLSDIDSGGSGVDMGLIMSLFAGFTMLLLGRHFIRRRERG